MAEGGEPLLIRNRMPKKEGTILAGFSRSGSHQNSNVDLTLSTG